MPNKVFRWFKTINYPSYVIFFVTARCNASCKMCFYRDNIQKGNYAGNELTLEEYEKISKKIRLINILGISGGEPFLRDDLSEIIKIIYKNCSPLVVDLPTNGFFIDRVLKQVEDIAGHCQDMIVDVQLSIDGPEKVHNEMRGLKDNFAKLKDTYSGLVALKNRYKNLKVKACVVYSHYNQDYIEELFYILKKEFKGLDRIVFSVVHGSVSNPEAFDFKWDRYSNICNKIRQMTVVKDVRDLHSVFTIALRVAKNYFLKEILKNKDMFRNCSAGKKVIVINEVGEVFPCEPLWEAVGDLRKNNYNLDEILNSDSMKTFNEKIAKERCNCHWGLPLSNTLLYKPRYYPLILFESARIITRSIFSKQRADICQ